MLTVLGCCVALFLLVALSLVGIFNIFYTYPMMVPTFWKDHLINKELGEHWLVCFCSPFVSVALVLAGLITEALIAFLAFVVWTGEITYINRKPEIRTIRQILDEGRESLVKPIWGRINL